MLRLFDIIFAIVGLAVFGPVICFLAILIYIEDGGSVFFRQKRLGKGMKPFRLIKLRTMRGGEITFVGHVVRHTGIDEVTQFVNVLKGEMSMVGPRPLTLADVARLGWTEEQFLNRWSVKPGVTGLAQIFGGRGKRVSWFLDQKYIEAKSLWVDLKLIIISFIINIFGKKRVQSWLRPQYPPRPQGARSR